MSIQEAKNNVSKPFEKLQNNDSILARWARLDFYSNGFLNEAAKAAQEILGNPFMFRLLSPLECDRIDLLTLTSSLNTVAPEILNSPCYIFESRGESNSDFSQFIINSYFIYFYVLGDKDFRNKITDLSLEAFKNISHRENLIKEVSVVGLRTGFDGCVLYEGKDSIKKVLTKRHINYHETSLLTEFKLESRYETDNFSIRKAEEAQMLEHENSTKALRLNYKLSAYQKIDKWKVDEILSTLSKAIETLTTID